MTGKEKFELEKLEGKIKEKIHEEAEKDIEKRLERIEPKLEACRELEESDQTRKDVKKAMNKVLCWGSIEFCCHPKKECPYRNSFLQALGLDKDDYIAFKMKMGNVFFDYLESNDGREP